jgi:magnesium chelatase family protein
VVVQTWGFVKTRPNYPWTNVELRAESGAVFRVSGATYSDALACLARVRSALQGMEVAWPGKALTLHVHPYCSQEDMMHLDVAVAAALLAIQGKISQPERLQTMAFCGMLGLKGDVVDPLPHRTATDSVYRVSPQEHHKVRNIIGLDLKISVGWEAVTLLKHLSQVLTFIQSVERCNLDEAPQTRRSQHSKMDVMASAGWDSLEGEAHAKKWLCIAAKWKLPVLLAGPPGVGKSSLVRASAGLLHGSHVPFLAPHPTGGTAGLLGAWRKGQPVAGAWAMADGGVLFLDEFPEWPRPARESLRHIMDTGVLDLHRADGCARWQSSAWILAAMNLCACGQNPPLCVCASSERKQYQKRLSGPLLERFPVQLEVGTVTDSSFERPWGACQQWVQQERPSGMEKWSPSASQRCEQVIRGGMTSKRLQRHLKILAEGHACWREAPEVMELDVQEAYDVMWMTRPGWRQG